MTSSIASSSISQERVSSDRQVGGFNAQVRLPSKEETGNDELEDDAQSVASTSSAASEYSSVSQDSLPPIHVYGHTYLGSGRLLHPSDASEARRMELQHELYKLCLDGRLTAARLPVEKAQKPGGSADGSAGDKYQILDVGSGSGLWACEMAQRYPNVEILGIDLSRAMLPEDVPPNLTFEIADAAEKWPPTMYDFIHMRNLIGGGIRDWNALLASAMEHLKPGGQLEFTDVTPRFFDVDPTTAPSDDIPTSTSPAKDDAMDEGADTSPRVGAACLEFETVFGQMCTTQRIDFDPAPRVTPMLTALGAEAIRERVDWMPIRSSTGSDDPVLRRKGEILGEVVDIGVENWALMLFGLGGWREEETRALVERVKGEVRDPKLRSCIRVMFTTARKPADD